MAEAPARLERHTFLGFGNNVCGNLIPAGPNTVPTPTVLDLDSDISEVIWHGWTCTIAQAEQGWRSWGTEPLGEGFFGDSGMSGAGPARVIGCDNPAAFLHPSGHVFYGVERSSERWNDVVVTGLGQAYASNASGLYRFPNLQSLMVNAGAFGPLTHPYLKSATKLRLHATESRAFIHISEPVDHLLEIVDVRSLPPARRDRIAEPVILRVVEDVEGPGIQCVITGSANRLGVVSAAGQAWLIPAKGEIESLDFGEDDVRLMGVGSDSEVVVTEGGAFVRGKSKSLSMD
ncbi:hypothetical protein IAU60_006811 [Kwoniella sp. DSM 27419]